MSSSTHISTLYREFADALREVLAENAVGLASRGRLARVAIAMLPSPIADATRLTGLSQSVSTRLNP